jgi:hypothetical protein
MEPDKREFLLKEFDALRRQMEQDIRQIGDLLRFAVLTSGAIWAWLLSRETKPDPPPAGLSLFVSVIPLLITLLFGLFVKKHLRAYIGMMGEYIRTVEKGFELEAWEAHFQTNKIKMGRSETRIWLFLGVGNFIGALIYFCSFFRICPK